MYLYTFTCIYLYYVLLNIHVLVHRMVKMVVAVMMTVAVRVVKMMKSRFIAPRISSPSPSMQTQQILLHKHYIDTQQCKCDKVMKKLDTVLDVLTNIGDELVLHGSDIHDIRLKSEAIQDKLEQLVSC